MNIEFKQYAEDLDNVEVCRICINPDGEFYVPNERDGRIARVAGAAARRAIAELQIQMFSEI